MKEVRIGLIGVGNMGQEHLKQSSRLKGGRYAALADIDAEKLAKFTEQHKLPGFDSAEAMMDSGQVDAVLIATPHKLHPVMTAAAFERGLHVLSEKPAGVSAADAKKMADAHAKHPRLVFAIMFQQRTDPIYRQAKHLIEQGRLGDLVRVSWNITQWMRTQAYYNSGTWRAKWDGEGGGVLLNQCPHNLDLLCWLCGMPARVIADVHVAKHHDIEVEDEVNALLRFENGATGTFITNTGEYPGVNRLEIVGDLGTLILDPNASCPLVFHEVDQSVRDFIATTPVAWSNPRVARNDVTPPKSDAGHWVIVQNFINAISSGEKLIAPGEDGRMSLELSNAMLLSGFNDSRPVDLPTNPAAFDKLLARLIEDAKARA